MSFVIMTVLVFQSCHNKSSETWQLKITEMYYLKLLKFQKPEVQNHGVGRVGPFGGLRERICPTCPFPGSVG